MTEPSLKARALRHLARRDHSRAELTKKLAPYGSAEEIETVLDRMNELSLLSDARLAASWVRTRAERFGRARLQGELARRGVARELIDVALADEGLESELERARTVWQTKFSATAAPADAREWARQARFLHARGFAAETIRAVLRDAPACAESAESETS